MIISRAACLASCALGLLICAHAQTYPAKPVRLVVPYPPGGSNDVLSRITAQAMTPGLGQQVIIDNRGGAGGMIGADHVAKSAPDGYTLVNVQASFTANAALRAKMAYDPIGYFAEFWWGIAAPSKTPNDILNRLASELIRALQSAELKQRFATEGAEPSVMSREQFTRFIANEIARWRKVAIEANIQPE